MAVIGKVIFQEECQRPLDTLFQNPQGEAEPEFLISLLTSPFVFWE